MNIEEIIEEVYEINKRECISPLTKRQIINIVKQLEQYKIKTEKEYRLALEFITKMRAEIIFYTNHTIRGKYKNTYNFYNTINYPITKVLSTMGIIDEEFEERNKTKDKIIKAMQNSIEQLVFELKIRIHDKNKELIYK